MAGTVAAVGGGRWAVGALAVLCACARGDAGVDTAGSRGPRAEGAPASPAAAPSGRTAAFAVQVGSFASDSNARALGDSLEREGFVVLAQPATVDGATRHRVLVSPTASEALARRVAAAFARGATVVPLPDGAAARDDDVVVVEASSLGMAARVRWARHRGGQALLVAHDPAAVEAEPVPDAVALVREPAGGALLLRDVWDATPSGDWQRIAVSWAYVLQGGEAMEIPRARWAAFGGTLPAAVRARAGAGDLLADGLRRAAFSVSGMGVAYGLGAVQVLPTDAPAGEVRTFERDGPPPVPIHRLDGWRVRWTREGALAVGVGLTGAQEMHPPARWVRVDAATGDSLSTADSAMLSRPAWTIGPTIDYQAVLDMPRPRDLGIAQGGVISSRGGWVRVQRGGRARVVGPGQALAATATGRWVLALATPVPARATHPGQVVLYRVAP